MLNNKQRCFLASSEEFQKIIDSDEILRRISDSKLNKSAELFSLVEMFRAVIRLGEVDCQPITPAVWAFLWAIDNAYTRDFKKITKEDTDIFFWILQHGVRRLECEVELIPARCAGAVEQAGMDYSEVAAELMQLVYYTFRPLSFLPQQGGSDEDLKIYDAWWLTRICDIAASESGENARDIMFNMPLSTCLYHFLHYREKNDPKHLIHRRTPMEINQQLIARLDQLGEEFCTKHKVR